MINFCSIVDAEHTLDSKPFSFLDSKSKQSLSNIMDLILLETSRHEDINNWQTEQIRNLIGHSINRSSFWRNRIGKTFNSFEFFRNAPIMSRSDLNEQVSSEGSLLSLKDGAQVTKHSTSGSTGVPASFYVTSVNANYNSYRSTAQFIMDERDLSLNRTRLGYGALSSKNEIPLSTNKHWLHHLYPFIKSGINKEIAYLNSSNEEIEGIVLELRKDSIGFLVAGPWMLEPVLRKITADELYMHGARGCLVYGGRIDVSVRRRLEAAGIFVSQSYSCEEVGPIAFECKKEKGQYHVATSNVFVETDQMQSIAINGKLLEKVLITHLHSYATPMIRYGLGDYAILGKGCRCGFSGPVLSEIYGRSKMLLSKPDGTIVPFFIETEDLYDLADIKEFRIRQKKLNRIEAEFVISNGLKEAQLEKLTKKLNLVAGDDIFVDIKFVDSIEWGADTKREGFRNEVIGY